ELTAGSIFLGGRDISTTAPKDRDIAMVFQNYALYPHMTVYDNIGFALKLAKVPKEEIDTRVRKAASILELEQWLDRKPGQLSGGQRQRVAMGRAIVRQPQAFLMDEPLSNLDAKLRVQTRTQIAALQRRLGVTTVYVTHDQVEAMTMGDRVAVLDRGVLQQCAAPRDLFTAPVNLFVAGFIGSPAMNFMPATIEGDTVKLPMVEVRLPPLLRDRIGQRDPGSHLIAGIRPENFEDAALVGDDARDRSATFRTKIELVESMGSEIYAHFTVTSDQQLDSEELRELAQDAGATEVPGGGEGGDVVARLSAESTVRQGEESELSIDSSHIQLFDPDDGSSLTAETGAAPAGAGGPR
ncbi:MAG TPA: ATP-binding cassette domain-containing protein, partial [Thermoleophilaceae bacterium]|nr:ATP-binding cassette domain-containing protein [Thermoleophilaceae bacterium]